MKLFSKLCEENYARIYKYIWCMLNNKSQAEDITQEVFLIAFEKGKAFLGHEKPEAFLYKTAKNLVYEKLREQKREGLVELDENSEISDEKDVFDTICTNKDKAIEEEAYIDMILGQISKKDYDFYRDYYIKHKPMKEIAKEYNMSEVAVRMKYVRLRRQITKIIKNLKLGEI